jgi:DNA (cytosine-5)-methyltransferase 1
MNELALFAGAGGGILGGHILGWRTVCAVEWEPYAASVLAARQNDGVLPPFPIWDDVQSFDGRPWRGIVDVVSGGFPCQDISVAGKGAGIDGARSGMWGHMARIVGEVRPRYVFVENSPALVTRGLGRVLGDLAALGYDCRWTVLGAADVGAPHQRDRFWLVATANPQSLGGLSRRRGMYCVCNGWIQAAKDKERKDPPIINIRHDTHHCGYCNEPLAHADQHAGHQWWTGDTNQGAGRRDTDRGVERKDDVAHADRIDDAMRGHAEDHAEEVAGRRVVAGGSVSDCGAGCEEGAGEGAGDMAHANSAQRQRGCFPGGIRAQYADACGTGWWESEPDVGRVANGVAARVDRLKAIGNGQVPLCAATAWQILTETP